MHPSLLRAYSIALASCNWKLRSQSRTHCLQSSPLLLVCVTTLIVIPAFMQLVATHQCLHGWPLCRIDNFPVGLMNFSNWQDVESTTSNSSACAFASPLCLDSQRRDSGSDQV